MVRPPKERYEPDCLGVRLETGGQRNGRSEPAQSDFHAHPLILLSRILFFLPDQIGGVVCPNVENIVEVECAGDTAGGEPAVVEVVPFRTRAGDSGKENWGDRRSRG